jgi:hypothetical protein
VAMLFNGTTGPTFRACGGNYTAPTANAGCSDAQSRLGTYGTGQTSLPATITPANISQKAAGPWVYLT